jgi:hypothetical protein
MADTAAASFRHTLRFLCASLLGSQVVMLMAVSAALDSDGIKEPSIWSIVVIVAVGIVAATVIPMIGYRVPALTPGTTDDETRRIVTRAVRSSTVVRFALAETTALVSVALGVAVHDGGTIVCVLGVAVSLTLSALHVWPSDRVLNKLREGLEREGAPSGLEAVLDAPPPRRG